MTRVGGTLRQWTLGVSAALAASTLCAAAAAAPSAIEAPGCCGSATLAVYGGWAAWSRLDEATRQYQLVLRSPGGTVSAPALPERARPFDVQLGPTAGGPVAVFSRCADLATLEGCGLRELALGSPGVEKSLSPPLGGSLHEPAIWDGELVFLRRRSGDENPERPGARPDDLYAWRIGAGRASAQQLASSKGSHGDVAWPRGLTGVISGLTVDSGWIAYVTDTAASGTPFALSTLWAQKLGQGPRLIDQVTGAAGNVCPPQFLGPSLASSTLTDYLHACAPTNSDLDRLTRYSLTSRQAERASYRFTGAPDEAIYSVLPYGKGAIWSNGGILIENRLTWKPIARPAPESFCGHDDLIC